MPKFIFWSYIDFIRSEQILLENMKKKLYKSLSIEDMSEITEEHKVMMDRDRKSSKICHPHHKLVTNNLPPKMVA